MVDGSWAVKTTAGMDHAIPKRKRAKTPPLTCIPGDEILQLAGPGQDAKRGPQAS